MKTLKKSLCLILALVFVLGLCTFGAGAAFTDDADINYDDAVSVMQGLGILKGYEAEDGTFSFQPAKNVTRAEAAKMITYMILGEKYAEKLPTASVFDDVADSHWASKYINYCEGKGIIKGYGDGNFGPNDPVTGVQMAKMLLVACGFGEMGEFGPDNWDVNAFAYAVEYHIYDDAETVSFEEGATREETALYVFNTLTKVDQMMWDVDQNKYLYHKAPFGTTVWSLSIDKGIIVANQATGEDYTVVRYDRWVELDNGTWHYSPYERNFTVETGKELIGHQVKMYYDYNEKKDTNKDYYYKAYLADDISTVVVADTNKSINELADSIDYVGTPFSEVDYYANCNIDGTLEEYLDDANAAVYWSSSPADMNPVPNEDGSYSWPGRTYAFSKTRNIYSGTASNWVKLTKANGSLDLASSYFGNKTVELVLDEEGNIISALTSDYAIGKVTEIDDEDVVIYVFDFDDEKTYDLADCYEGIAEDDYVTVDWVGDVYTVTPTTSKVVKVTEINTDWLIFNWYAFNNNSIFSMSKNTIDYLMENEKKMGEVALNGTYEFFYDSHFNPFAVVEVEAGAVSYAFITKTYETESTSYGDRYITKYAQAVDSEGEEVIFTYDRGKADANGNVATWTTNYAEPGERTLVKVIARSNGYTEFENAGTVADIKHVNDSFDGTQTKIKGRHFLTSATKYIYIRDDGADLDVAFGDILKSSSAADVWYIASTTEANIATVWVYGAPAAARQSDDIIYVKAGTAYRIDPDTSAKIYQTTPSGRVDVEGKSCNYFTVYLNGVSTSGVKVKADAIDTGFYTYSVDANGIYTLSPVAAGSFEIVKNVANTPTVEAIYRNKLYVAGTAMDDFDLSDAMIVDLTTGHYIDAKGYTKNVDSVSAMAAALKLGYYINLEYMVDSVSEEPTGAIYVTYCAKYPTF